MTDNPAAYVLDTGPLSHFARAQWLGVLKTVLHGARVLIPDVVEVELRAGASQHHHLRAVLDAGWIEIVPVDTAEQLVAFTYYEQRLVGADGRNLGECGVLALAETTPDSIAIIDDRVAKNAERGARTQSRSTRQSRPAVRRHPPGSPHRPARFCRR